MWGLLRGREGFVGGEERWNVEREKVEGVGPGDEVVVEGEGDRWGGIGMGSDWVVGERGSCRDEEREVGMDELESKSRGGLEQWDMVESEWLGEAMVRGFKGVDCLVVGLCLWDWWL